MSSTHNSVYGINKLLAAKREARKQELRREPPAVKARRKALRAANSPAARAAAKAAWKAQTAARLNP